MRIIENPPSVTVKLGLFLLLLFLGFAYFSYFSNAAETTITPATVTVTSASGTVLTSITIGNGNVIIGDSTDFTLSFTNNGGASINLTANVTIYDSTNTKVDVVIFTQTTLGAGETQNLIKSWNTANVVTGDYRAEGIGVANNANATNQLNVNFTVTVRPPPQSGGGTQVRNVSAVVPDIPEIKIIYVKLSPLLEFTNFPIFKEVFPGEQVLLLPTLLNSGTNDLLISLSSSSRTASFFESEGGTKLKAKEEKSIPIQMNLPNDVSSGYLFSTFNVYADGEKAAVFYPYMAKVNTFNQTDRPYMAREAQIDLKRNKTIITLTVENKANRKASYLQIYEEINKKLAFDTKSINFVTQPAKIIKDDPLIRWDFEELLPNERRTITYELDTVSTDYRDFTNWPSPQLVYGFDIPSERITLTNVEIPIIYRGEEKKISFSLFNTGATSEKVDVDILATNDFKITPNAFSLYVPARESVPFVFAIKPNSEVPVGTYAITLRLGYSGVTFDKNIFVPVDEKITVPQIVDRKPSSIFSSIFSFIKSIYELYSIPIAVILLILIMIIGVMLRSKKASYKEERVRDIANIKKLIKREE